MLALACPARTRFVSGRSSLRRKSFLLVGRSAKPGEAVCRPLGVPGKALWRHCLNTESMAKLEIVDAPVQPGRGA